jgi:hypothetical protein
MSFYSSTIKMLQLVRFIWALAYIPRNEIVTAWESIIMGKEKFISNKEEDYSKELESFVKNIESTPRSSSARNHSTVFPTISGKSLRS